MNSAGQQLRRQQLDRDLLPLTPILQVASPPKGWIKTIREALGMNLQTLARRVGLASRSTAHQMEQAEVDESISIRRLRIAADALGCDLAVVFIPREPLAALVERRAKELAAARLSRLSHSMELDRQVISSASFEEALNRTASEILARGGPILWD